MKSRMLVGLLPDARRRSSTRMAFTFSAPILSSLSTVRMTSPALLGQAQHGIEAVENLPVVHPDLEPASGPGSEKVL